MGSAWESLQITIGKLFLPVVRAVVDALTGLLRLLDKAAQSKVGAAVLKMAAALATGVVAVTGFSAGLWAISRAAPFVAKALLPILIPLFVSAFRRADELATAMECRCYQGGEGRTKMKLLRYGRNDFFAFGGLAALIAMIAVLAGFGL